MNTSNITSSDNKLGELISTRQLNLIGDDLLLQKWSLGPNMLSARLRHTSFGNSITYLTVQIGASTASASDAYVKSQEKFNGVVWSKGTDALSHRVYAMGSGNPDSGVITGGNNGGSNNSKLALCETFNGSTWSNDTMTMIGRDMHSAVGTNTNCMIHGGRTSGTSSYTSNCQSRYSVGTWSTNASLLTSRYAHSAAGTVSLCIVIGGSSTGYSRVDVPSNIKSVEKFDGNTWSLLSANINVFRTNFTSTGIYNNCMIQGGNPRDCERYNGSVWVTIESLNTFRISHTGIGPSNSKSALIAGGYPGISGSHNTIEIYK